MEHQDDDGKQEARANSPDSRSGLPTQLLSSESPSLRLDDPGEISAAAPAVDPEVVYPVKPNAIQFVEMPKTVRCKPILSNPYSYYHRQHVNHTYRDFSNTPAEANFAFPISVDRMSFHEKLYHLLTFTSAHCRQLINWCSHGRAFEIKDPDELKNLGILRLYFGYDSVQRFRKQLSDYGYKPLVRDPKKTSFYSEFLLSGMPHVLQFSPEHVKRRRLVADPDNEPDFDKIAELFPLPADRKALMIEARKKLEERGFIIFDNVFHVVLSGGHM